MKLKALIAVVGLVASVLLAVPTATAESGTTTTTTPQRPLSTDFATYSTYDECVQDGVCPGPTPDVAKYSDKAGFKQIALSETLRVEPTEQHGCAILGNGELYCWGNNMFGQADPPEGKYVSVAVGQYHSCAVETGGQIRCWGGGSAYWYNPTVGVKPVLRLEKETVTPPSGSYTSIASNGHRSMCAIRTNGWIHCWGGDLGEGYPPGGTYKQIAVGNGFACAVRTDGQLRCWPGDNYGPPLGTWVGMGFVYDDNRVLRPPSGEFVQVTAGLNFACGLRTDGHAVCWGNDALGRFDIPKKRFKSLSAAFGHTCGRVGPKQDHGAIRCWGDTVDDWDYWHGRKVTDVVSTTAITCTIRQGKHGPNSMIVCKKTWEIRPGR